jgi:AcrR family transcriptional regulator
VGQPLVDAMWRDVTASGGRWWDAVANPAAYTARRDAFVDAAVRLAREKGYDRLVIADVIAEVGASKGAFQHYFDSKEALLAAVVDRTVEEAIGAATSMAADPALTPLEKLQGVFSGIYAWKAARPEYQPDAVAASLRTWFSDENRGLVERMRTETATRLTPVLAAVLAEGVGDGSFSLADREGSASVVTSLTLALNEAAVRLFLGRRERIVSFETATRTLASYAEALERILGVPAGSWPLLHKEAARLWFG